MPSLLLELFSEEIPARMQAQAAEDLANLFTAELRKNGFAVDGDQIKSFVTPRRLTISIKNLPVTTPDISKEEKGPRMGAPDAALQGFLKKFNLAKEALVERDGVYFAHIQSKGRETQAILKESIEAILHNFPWPKSMRWGSGDARWVRPLHNILCLLGTEIVPVEFAGLTANNITYGHRFLAPDAITIPDADADYVNILDKAYVIADFDERKLIIREQINKLAEKHHCQIIADEKLLDEVSGLVEWPVAFPGNIDAEFMDLPKEVLITVMRTHQKYFALHQGEKLSPHFITIANRFTADKGKAIIAGNERVLRARFADGKFFWDQDRKIRLDEWAKGLEHVTYHAKLGTMAQRVTDIHSYAKTIAHELKADAVLVARAVELSKADLVTGMVGEFAELQGIMGRYYALQQGEDAQVADAIRDQYIHDKDRLPTAPVSICLALAERISTLVNMFSIGEKPTGSKDPFALRRAAIAVIQIILKSNLRLPLQKLKFSPDLLSFFADRLQVILREEGIAHDRIQAVFTTGEDDMVRLVNRVRALQHFLSGEAGVALLAAYKRASNILKIEEKKDNHVYSAKELNQALLTEAEEKSLFAALHKVSTALPALLEGEDFIGAMTQLSLLREPVDQFFEKIMVNAPDRDIRTNRLRLLASIRGNMDALADFSKIEG